MFKILMYGLQEIVCFQQGIQRTSVASHREVYGALVVRNVKVYSKKELEKDGLNLDLLTFTRLNIRRRNRS